MGELLSKWGVLDDRISVSGFYGEKSLVWILGRCGRTREANATVVKGSEHKKAFARSNQLIKESPSQRKEADRVEVPNVRLVTDFRNRADSADRISHWSGAITRVVLGELSIK